MKRIIFIITIMLSVLFSYASEYHNETHKITHFDYSQYTVTYTDIDGITRTVPITDEATTPEHQMALLREVYKNPDIPGIHYAYDYNGYQTRKIDYNRRGHLGDANGNWLGSKNDIYPNPTQDGMTLLIVYVKDSWKTSHHSESNMREYFNKAIASIKLITNFTRVNDSINPGYLFSIDGATNRFFFISKGKPRASYTKPLFALFEQISPVNAMTGDQSTDSFIDDMKAGNSYTCYHDCSNVFSMTGGHWFTISKSGENYNLKNLSIFIPDRRFEYEQDPMMSDNDTRNNQYVYNEYGNSQNVGQEVWEIMPHVIIYNVNLHAELDRSYVDPHHFKVSLDWTSSLSDVNPPEHYYVYTVDEQGNRTLLDSISQPTQLTHYEYIVPRELDSYKIYYVVTGALINYEEDETTVVLDDNNEPLVTLTADSKIASVNIPGLDPYFTESSEHKSRYDIRNEINIYKNKISVCPTTPTDYMAIRNTHDEFYIVREDNLGDSIVIASIQFTETVDGYDYTVTYNSSSQNTNITYDSEQPTLQGSITGFDSSFVYIIDRFTVSTKHNDHASQYSYRVVQANTGTHSNTCTIPIHKTTHIVKNVGYNLADVDADTDRGLTEHDAIMIDFNTISNPIYNIDKYDVYNVNSLSLIGKAEHFNNSSTYKVICRGTDNVLNDYRGEYTDTVQMIDYNSGVFPKYVPVIETIGDNTYGSDIKGTQLPQLSVRILNTMKTNTFAGAGEWLMGYLVNLKITPSLTDSINDIYYYRVWRVNELLNELQETTGSTWSSNYSEIKQIYPGTDDIYVSDIFLDEPMSVSRKYTYIVRMYSTDGNQYYITEVPVDVMFDNNTITGIDEIENNDITVEYYNILGMRSSRPFSGINVMIVRDKNGNIKVTKKIFN